MIAIDSLQSYFVHEKDKKEGKATFLFYYQEIRLLKMETKQPISLEIFEELREWINQKIKNEQIARDEIITELEEKYKEIKKREKGP